MEGIAAIYCRLSAEDEDLEPEEYSESIQNQQLMLSAYAREHRLTVYCMYVDDNCSGLDNSRPAFCRLLEDARHGRFQIILCKNQSRFTRDMETAEQYLNNLFPLWGIRFIGICDGTDTADLKNRKLRQINGLVNQWYSEDLSDNIRQVLRDKMQHGQFIGSFASYGYTKDRENPHRLVPDPVAAAIVRQIYECCLDGMSLRKIAAFLNQNRTPPPSLYKAQQGLFFQTPFSAPYHSSRWSAASVRRILTNPVYTGTLIQGTTEKESVKSARRIRLPKEQWSVKPHAHAALVSEECFLQAQQLLASRRKQKNGTHTPASS